MPKKNEKLAREARVAVEKWNQYFKYNVDNYHRIMNFVLGRQWTDDEEDMLKTFKKVPLQFNKLATLVNSLLGEQQQNTPQLEVFPLSNVDEETAAIRQTITKNMILSTDAKTVYQVAGMQAIVGGYGAYMVDHDYVHAKSFEQDIVYRSFKDPTRCFWDVGAEHVNKIDGMVCGSLTRMTREKFRSLYGRELEQNILTISGITQTKEEIALATDPALKDDSFSWADDEGITIIDYYKRVFKKDTLYKMSNGDVLNQDELEEVIERSQNMLYQQAMPDEYGNEPLQTQPSNNEPQEEDDREQEEIPQDERLTLFIDGMPVQIAEKRSVKISSIKHYRIAGEYILDESDFPSEDLPIIFVDQNSYFAKDGKQICRPFVIDAIDAQRYLNYLGTQSAFVLKISRYDQFMAPKKCIQGLDTQRDWRDPYSVKGVLTYDETPSGAKPEQLRPPELSQSLVQQYQRAIEDLYTSTGLYPTRLGEQGNEVSGAAIDARTRQGSYSTFVVFNSINRAIAAGGQIVNQMIPKIYDSERVLSIMTTDEGYKNIVINRQVDEFGERIENDIRKGTYEVRLLPGASYEGQKQEALNSLNMVLQANPQLLNLFADLYAENLPLANTIEIKNRLKTIVPPNIIEAGKTGKMPNQNGQQQPNPEQMQLLIQQQQMQIDAQFKQKDIELKEKEYQLKVMQIQTELEIEREKLEAEKLEVAGKIKEQELRYLAETQRTESDAAISHADNLVKILTHTPKGFNQ